MPGNDRHPPYGGKAGSGGLVRPNPQSQESPLNRSLPLYAGLGFSNRPEKSGIASLEFVKDTHPGLLFDKFIDTWDMAGGEFREQKPSGDRSATTTAKARAGGKRTFLDEAAKRGCNHSGLAEYHTRRNQLLKMLDGKDIPFQTDWRFVSGLSSGHPYETGFIWHRTLGVPYLPGSSIKGLIRAWAEQWNTDRWNDFKELFGDKEGTGKLIVFDAIPIEAPKLEVDIMNPHYSEYYQSPQSTPPADYLSPKPVFFLAVAEDTKFTFALAPRRSDNEPDLTKGINLLIDALKSLGAGAKTVVGYGRMRLDHEEMDRQIKESENREANEAERKRKAELDAYLASLSPQRQRIERLRADASVPGVAIMTNKREALLQAIATLLKDAAKWPNAEDRGEAAKFIEEMYTQFGWGNEQKAQTRKEEVLRLRRNA